MTRFSFSGRYDPFGQPLEQIEIHCPRGWREPGQEIPESSPFLTTGEGDVYEGDFPLTIRRDGTPVGDPIVIGGVGAWGEWRDFETTVSLDIAPGPIELVYVDPPSCTPGDDECSPAIEIVVPVTLE